MIEQDIHPWCRVLSWCFSEVWVYTQLTAHLYTCTPVTLYPVSHVSTLIFVHSTFNMYCSLDECDDWLDPELIWFLAKMLHLDAFWDDGCFSSHWSSALNCWHINIEWKQSLLPTSGIIAANSHRQLQAADHFWVIWGLADCSSCQLLMKCGKSKHRNMEIVF